MTDAAEGESDAIGAVVVLTDVAGETLLIGGYYRLSIWDTSSTVVSAVATATEP